MVFPPPEFPMLLKISPTIAMGILIQLSHPSSGINATNIMISDTSPRMKPINFAIIGLRFMLPVLIMTRIAIAG